MEPYYDVLTVQSQVKTAHHLTDLHRSTKGKVKLNTMYNFDFQGLITSYTETVHMSDVMYRAIFRVAAAFSWHS
jgi:hypothetical protein